MAEQNYIPADYEGLKVVDNLCSLLETEFGSFANVILYPRRFNLDFDRLANLLASYFDLQKEEIFIKFSQKQKLERFMQTLEDPEMVRCMKIILTDMDFFHNAGARPHFRILRTYASDEKTHDFHVDGLNQNFDRFMTCYNEPVTQFVKNSDVLKIQGHKAFCKDEAVVYQFRAGDIWKQRVRNKTLNPFYRFIKKLFQIERRRAFVHRAQRSENPRIMLVGDLRKNKI